MPLVSPFMLKTLRIMISGWAVMVVGLSACGRGPQRAADTALVPSADLVLRQMSAKLARAKQLTFKVTRQFDVSGPQEDLEEGKTQIDFAVARPDKLRAQSVGTEGARAFYTDGKNITLFDESMKLYSTVASKGTIDEIVSRVDEKYGFTPPLAEFTLNDPYKRIGEQIQSSSYKGIEAVNGVDCHHVAAEGELANSDLWVAISDQLPRRLLVTFKQREGSPQLKADFSDWNLTPNLDESVFAFAPPKDAEEIEMVVVEVPKEDAAKTKEPGKKK